MKHVITTLTTLALMLLTHATLAATSPVGSTPGSFAVSPSGAATYSIPIQVPPGVNGMQPNISLVYNSQAGNGIAGVGWNIGGLSVITRCGATIDRDGFKGGVNLDANDKFCLDGQRLIDIGASPASICSGGREYRTEIESFSKVVSCGMQGVGPLYFKVQGKDGSITEYGKDNGSQQIPQGAPSQTVLSWAISKIQDANNNAITFTYFTETGEQYIDHIDYTLNNGVAIGGVTRKVQFNYSVRTDVETSYVGGGVVKIGKRLTNVQTFVGAVTTSVRDYRLAYDTSAVTGRTRLTSVKECESNGVCLVATKLVWQETIAGGWVFAPDYTPPYEVMADGVGDMGARFVDVNGDGLVDMVYHRYTSATISQKGAYLNTGRGWVSASEYAPPFHIVADGIGDMGARFEDVNGDGLVDMVYHRWTSAGSQKGAYLNTGSGWGSAPDYTPPFHIVADGAGDMGARFIDVNGDGLVDMVYHRWTSAGSQKGAYLNSGRGWIFAPDYAPPFHIVADGVGDMGARFEDVNGDGLMDMVYHRWTSAGSQKGAYLNTGSGWGSAPDYTPPYEVMADGVGDMGARFVDVNGDGLVDMVYHRYTSATISQKGAYLNTGRGWVSASEYAPPFHIVADGVGDMGARFEDVNGDGLVDMVYHRWNAAGSQKGAYLNTGSGWESVPDYTPPFHIVADGAGDMGARFIDVNGDGLVDMVYHRWTSAGSQKGAYLNTNLRPDVLASITTGLNAQTTLTYKPLTDNSVYTKEDGAVYPVKDVQEPMYVISSVTTTNGIGGITSPTTYSYAGMKEHQLGRGNLGFRTMTVTGPDGITSITTNNQNFPYVGMPMQVDVTQPNGALLSRSASAFSCLSGTGGVLNASPASCAPPPYSTTASDGSTLYASYGSTLYLPFVSSNTSSSWDLNGAVLPTSTSTVNTLDAYGNTLSATSSSDGFVKTSTTTYFNDATNWRLGLPVKSVVSSTVPAAFWDGVSKQTDERTSVFVYQLGTGIANYQLKDEVVEPASVTITNYAPLYTLGALTLVTSYTYDATYGHRTKVTQSGTGITARSTTTSMDFVTNKVTTTNALLHSETQTLDARFGVPLSLTGPNGLTTTWEYDGFGRKVKESRADGTYTTSALTDCGSAGCYLSADLGTARYSSTTRNFSTLGTDMSPPVTVYYDMLGRELRGETQGYGGTATYKDTQYDSLGRVAKSTRPYFSSSSPQWTRYTYDVLGRASTATAPDNAVATTAYNGLTTTLTTPTGTGVTKLVRTETKNSQGQWVTVLDAMSNTITYKYDAFGNLTKVINPVPTGLTATSNTVTTTYDLRGRKTGMTDPDMGTWAYTYNVLGELLTQKDAKLQTATMTYDVLGRMKTRVETEGTSTWTYDTATNGKGKLASVTGPTNSYARSYVYDNLGRPAIVGTSINSVLYNMSVGYDLYTGRTTNVKFPSTTASFGNFAFYNNYNALGFLEMVTSGDNRTGTQFWKLDANGIDAQGRVTSETMGNGTNTRRTYNPITDLLSDIDTTGPSGTVQDSNYTYFPGTSNLNTRSSTIPGFYGYTETFGYDDLNRVTSVSGIGTTKTFTYDSLGNIRTKTGTGTYTYGSTKPHAVTAVTGTVNGVVNPTYVYDANGNQTTGAGRTLTYASFNLPKSVATASLSQSYAYDAEHQRIVMTQGTETSVYINPRIDAGSHFEKETKSGVTEYKHYIYAGGKPVAMYAVKSNSTVPYTRYLHTDHLGSVDVITSETGSVVERLSYDTWGKRRNANGTDSATNISPVTTHHGYTGHEMNDSFGLINMNGRWYDPSLGKMMQADPTIPSATNLQAFNRYAYVLNNPLSFTDPSGFKPFWKQKWFKKAVATVVIVALVAYTGGAAYNAAYWAMAAQSSSMAAISIGAGMMGGMASGAVMGAAVGYSQTHNLKGTVNGAVRGGATGMMSGAIGGGVSALTANSGFLTQALGKSVTSGMSSTLGGGSFRDGFRMGAITATASATYEAVVGYAADPNPGEGVVAKPDGTGPVQGKINFGTDRTAEEIMSSPKPGLWDEGGPFSKFANGLSTGNSIGGIHDTIQAPIESFGRVIGGNIGASAAFWSTNFFTMVPAATFNAYATMYENPAAMGVYASSR